MNALFLQKYRLALLGLFVLVVLGIPMTLLVNRKPTENRTQAAATTVLSVEPSTVQKRLNETFTVDLMLDPGEDLVTFVRFILIYDPARIKPIASNPVAFNASAFPSVFDGPILTDGRIAATVSIGSDATKMVTTPVKVASITFQTVAPGTSTITLSSTETQVLSAGADDSSSDNVLSSIVPATITVGADITPTGPAPTISTTPTPSPGIIPTSTPIPVPTINPANTRVNLTVFLHGIGKAGDNSNLTDSSKSNKTPISPSRTASLILTKDAASVERSGIVTYDPPSGSFKGTIDLGTEFSGNHTLKLSIDGYLNRQISSFYNLVPAKEFVMPPLQMITGDTNNDNRLNILDYNILVGCYSDFAASINCTTDEDANLSDLNDDGKVNTLDLNLFLRELTNDIGD